MNKVAVRNIVLGLARLAFMVTGGMDTFQTGTRIDIVFMLLALQAAESESYRPPMLISSFQKKIKPGSV